MSNTRHSRVLVPLAADPVAEGPSILAVLADALDLALTRHSFLPGCGTCVAAAKQAEHAHGVAVGNARQAAEPEPVRVLPDIQQALTWQHGVPVCFDHYEPADVPQP